MPNENDSSATIVIVTQLQDNVKDKIIHPIFQTFGCGEIAGHRPLFGLYLQGGSLMLSNTMLKDEGMRILAERLGLVEAERFIVLMRREPFGYTKWR